MYRKSRRLTSRRSFSAPVFILLTGVVMTLAATSFSSSLPQGGGAGKVSLRDLNFVLITGADVRNLPSGENRLVQKEAGEPSASRQGTTYVTPGTVRNTSTATRPTGKVTFFIDGIARNTSVPLTKTGSGQLIFPTANQSAVVTKAGKGALENSSNSAGVTKVGPGTLILTSSGGVVYEFRNLGLAELDRVLARSGTNTYTGILTLVQQQRPEGAIKDSPFKRLLVGPAEGIARVEGWQAAKDTNPAKYSCQGKFCQCNGTADCLGLANSASCSSDMNCDGSGNSVKCYCTAR